MEDKVKPRGVKRGETPSWKVGRKRGTAEKTATFLGVRVTPEEKKELSKIFDDFKKKNNLKSSEAIKKMVYNLKKE
nr:MAG TPA: NikA, BACTERIAL CONJUGATION, RELAXASE, DNA [Caudoviricetes sp.]